MNDNKIRKLSKRTPTPPPVAEIQSALEQSAEISDDNEGEILLVSSTSSSSDEMEETPVANVSKGSEAEIIQIYQTRIVDLENQLEKVIQATVKNSNQIKIRSTNTDRALARIHEKLALVMRKTQIGQSNVAGKKRKRSTEPARNNRIPQPSRRNRRRQRQYRAAQRHRRMQQRSARSRHNDA